MAPESKLDSVSDAGREQHRKGFQVDGIRWEWPNPKGEGLQKLVPREHIVGMLSAVENGVKNRQRAWDGLLQQGTNFCSRFQLPNVWGGKGRQALQAEEPKEPGRAAVLSTRLFKVSIHHHTVMTFNDMVITNNLQVNASRPARTSTLQGATTERAESGSKEMQPMETQFRYPEEFRVPEVNSGGAVSKEDLGRATWTFLHTLAAQYPDQPTRQQERDIKELMSIMTRLYPCKTCAEHFKEVLKAYPVKSGSGVELAQWMCQVHNVVNRSLGKPQFPCQRVDARWGELHCDEGACDLEGRLLYR